jgi:hypothetical protein
MTIPLKGEAILRAARRRGPAAFDLLRGLPDYARCRPLNAGKVTGGNDRFVGWGSGGCGG